MSSSTWKKCSACKSEIPFGQAYWACNVSTCNRKRTAMYFCSVSCWETHLPMMRHREAWAVEKQAPSASEWERLEAADRASEAETSPSPRPVANEFASSGVRTERRVVSSSEVAPKRRTVAAPAPTTRSNDDVPREILIVASKLKKYIKARSGMNTSDGVLNRLSDHLRQIADQAIESARDAERKTVLDRDVPPVPRH